MITLYWLSQNIAGMYVVSKEGDPPHNPNPIYSLAAVVQELPKGS